MDSPPPPSPRGTPGAQARALLIVIAKMAVLLAALFGFGLLVFWVRRSLGH